MLISACRSAVHTCKKRLRGGGKLHSDEIAFDHRQPGSFENLPPLFRVTEQEANERALG